jgi:CSLREA domain-containing protein
MKPTLLTFPILILASLSTAQAATFTVTRTDDPAPGVCLAADCSLREAILAANLTAEADSVVLGTGTYVLTRVTHDTGPYTGTEGPLRATTSLTLTGAGATRSRIRWDAATPHQHSVLVFGSDLAPPTQMTIRSVTVSHGRGTSGGCIFAGGSSLDAPIRNHLVLDRVTLESCESSHGGALSLWAVDLSLSGTRIRDNVASLGGALNIHGNVDIDSQNSLISSNRAGWGGAVAVMGFDLWPLYTNVVWVDDGSSVISDNDAEQTGGAIFLENRSTLDLSTIDTAPAGQLMTISNNTSGGTGGAINLYPFSSGGVNRLSRLRINDNKAVGDGGAVYAQGELQITDVEIARNRTKTGVGGGIALYGTYPYSRIIERVSLQGNLALSGGGGAIAAGCQAVEVSNSAFFGNQAGAGRGQAIETAGATTLRHVTVSGNVNSSAPSPALRKLNDSACGIAGPTVLRYTNSLIVDACQSTVAGQLLSDGGNQLGPDAAACPALSHYDRRQSQASVFRLSIGTFGGDFDVLGWTSDLYTRPQRDFGRTGFCAHDDIRGMPRSDGRCDAGAFEQ